MATVNLGRIKFVWQGAYSGATAYVADDVVSYNGSSYICILASTGNLPTNATYWSLMAQSGTDITSLAGLAQGDVLYYNGTSWVRLGAGTSGQFLQTNGASANPSWGTVTTKFVNYYFNEATAAQVISGSSYTFYDINGLSRTITPASASSKFWIHGRVTTGTASNHTYIALNCGGSRVHLSDAYSSSLRTTSSHSAKTSWDMSDQTFAYLWEPATSSAVTIKIQGAQENPYIYINRSDRDDGNIYDSRASSSMTIFELTT
jgi:hypothetical protein